MSLRDQEIRFCTSADGVRLAYAIVGRGPPLVKAANWLSHLEFDWNSPVWRHWLVELSRDRTLVRYDERGCGLSDWAVEDFSLDAWVADLETVVDSLGLERFPLLGISQGGPIAITYALRHPERVTHLILYGAYARGRGHRQLSPTELEERELMIRLVSVGWGKDHPAFRQVFTSLFIPDGTPEQMHWFNELQRISTTPENATRMLGAFDQLDVQDAATRLRVPTLVIHGTGDMRVPFAEGRHLAALIPGARFVPLEARNHVLLASEPAFTRFVYCVREFLGLSPAPAPSRERIEEIFDRALDLAPAERPAFLASACGEDAELRVAVGRLLASAEATGVTARLAGAIADALEPESRDTAPPALPHYEVLERLGAGAMGVVFKACDRRLNRLVALKLLADYGSGEPAMRRRFVQEAKAAASLDHPNICAVYGFEEMPDGRLAIIMPYYEGETLRAKLDRGPLPAAEALDYAAQVAAGLAHAHAAGVVHRDIKPANLVVTHAGRVKILDFGIAKLADAELTRSGMILGTYAYMSPEQASGERGVDHRTDLWALGVVLYEMVAGKPPFAAETNRALLAAIQFAEPAPLASLRPDLPPDLDRLLARLLAKEPEDRISSATAALELLEHLSRLAYRATTATVNRSQTP